MNIYSAIRGLTSGQATKPSSWRGYVERIDANVTDPLYSASSSYRRGDKVTYNEARYLCVTNIDTPEAFDFGKWLRIDNDRYIVFVDADDASKSANPSAIYLGTVSGDGSTITYTRLDGNTDVPEEVKAVHPSWLVCPSPVDMPDAELFTALVSDSWESGQASDYEIQRVGGGGRW